MPAASPVFAPSATAPLALTILFGTETGTAENLARRAAERAATRGFSPLVLDMADVDVARLATVEHLLVVVSTYGYGEPPGNAIELHAALESRKPGTSPAALPAELSFSVCALGDEHYADFCQCGRDFDRLLETWGATRIAPRADCSLEYEDTFEAWLETALGALLRAATAKGDIVDLRAPPGVG